MNNKPDEQFYLQLSGRYCGNDMLWWAKGGAGYTTDLSKAEIYSREGAISLHKSSNTTLPWPKEYIDNRARMVVDFQNTDVMEAQKILMESKAND